MKDPDHPEPFPDLNRFLRSAQRSVGLTGEVSVRIASDSEMRRLNRIFRGKDKATDVLSFPAYHNGNSQLRGSMPRLYHAAGDIAISSRIARENAKALGHSFEDELKILLLHGLLHLAGHDHESDNGQMAALEEKLRGKLKLPTGLIERLNGGNVRPNGGSAVHKGGSPPLSVGGRRTSSPPEKQPSNRTGFSPGQSGGPPQNRKIKANRVPGALKRSSPLLKQGVPAQAVARSTT